MPSKIKTQSGLGVLVKNPKDMPVNRAVPVYGIALHTTGSGIVEQAIKLGIDPLEHAVNYYLKPDSYSAHYVVGYDGALVQISLEEEKCYHIGLTEEDRKAYSSGAWEKKVSPTTLKCWKDRWPVNKNPLHLTPTKGFNESFVGIEMLPLLSGSKWQPMFKGSRYTLAQHQMVVMLAKDIAERHGFPDKWHRSSRLLGHEDCTPLTRSVKSGGWDPGASRMEPWFDWEWVLNMIEVKE